MKDWWQSLESRERLFVGGLGVFVVIFLFYTFVVEPLFTGVTDYREKVSGARADLVWMQRAAPRIQQQPAATRAPSGDQPSLNVLINSTLRRYGLRTSSTQQVGQDGLRVKIDDASFDAMVQWLGELNARHGVAIEGANVREADARG